MSEPTAADERTKDGRRRWWLLLFQVPWLSLVLLVLLAAVVFGPFTHWEPWVPGVVLEQSSAFDSSAVLLPGGARVLTIDVSGVHRLWDTATGRCCATFPANLVTWSPDGSVLFTRGRDGIARLRDAGSGDCVLALKGHGARVEWACFSPDGRRITTTSDDRTARVWDVSTGDCVLVLKGACDDAAYSPDGSRIVTFALPEGTHLWDAGTGAHAGEVTMFFLRYTCEGRRILAKSAHEQPKAEQLCFLDAANGELLRELRECRARKIHLEDVSSDGRLCVAGLQDEAEAMALKIWDLNTGRCKAELEERQRPDTRAMFSPDGSLILTCAGTDDEGSIRIWETKTGRRLAGWEGKPCTWVTFFPDRRRVLVVIASAESKSIVLDVETMHVLAELNWQAAGKPEKGVLFAHNPAEGLAALLFRRRPEWWWGVFYLPEFWLAFALGAACAWSAVRDLRRLRKKTSRA